MKNSLRNIPRNVYLLGLLSLFNDVSADMIAPLLPVYLATMGLGAGFLGILEGVANALWNITGLFSGRLDDRLPRSKGLAVFGYGLSSVVRLFLAIPIPGIVFAARFLDRIGKGIRTPPRDHLLTQSLEKKDWGKAFGVQRAMDHIGTLFGPPMAALLLKSFGFSYSQVFLIAAIPAVLSVILVPIWIQEKPRKKTSKGPWMNWGALPPPLKRYFFVVFLIALSTPSELFLVLKMKELGIKPYYLPLAYGLMTFCTMLAAYIGGYLADHWSGRRTIALGGILASVVYVAFAFNRQVLISWILISFYGLQAGLVEAPQRAYTASVVPEEIRASAMGWYYFAYGLGLLPASAMFGLLWTRLTPSAAFLISAGLALLVVPLIAILPSHRPERHRPQHG